MRGLDSARRCCDYGSNHSWISWAPGRCDTSIWETQGGISEANIGAVQLEVSDQSDHRTEQLRSNRMATEEDFSHVIFEAATDGTDQLRYVATEDIKPLLAARRETSEAEYGKPADAAGTKPVFPCTSLCKRATLSSPVTHHERQ